MTNTTTHDVMVAQTEAFAEALAALQGDINSRNQFRANMEAVLAGEQAGFAALSDDLAGVISSQMFFSASVDVNEANPTNTRGGVFNSLKTLIEAAPVGARVEANLIAGQTVPVDATIAVENRRVDIIGVSGNEPTVQFNARSDGNVNWHHWMNVRNGAVRFDRTNVASGGKADPALDWHIQSSGIRSAGNGDFPMFIGFSASTVTWEDARGLIHPYVGDTVFVGTYLTTLDGPFYLVGGLGSSIGTIAKHTLTLANGATLVGSGGTLGTNLLQA